MTTQGMTRIDSTNARASDQPIRRVEGAGEVAGLGDAGQFHRRTSQP